MKNTVDCYEHAVTELVRDEFDKEVDRWIDKGILVSWGGGEKRIVAIDGGGRIKFSQSWISVSSLLCDVSFR